MYVCVVTNCEHERFIHISRATMRIGDKILTSAKISTYNCNAFVHCNDIRQDVFCRLCEVQCACALCSEGFNFLNPSCMMYVLVFYFHFCYHIFNHSIRIRNDSNASDTFQMRLLLSYALHTSTNKNCIRKCFFVECRYDPTYYEYIYYYKQKMHGVCI